MSDLEKINSSFIQKIETVESKEGLQNLKTEFFKVRGGLKSAFFEKIPYTPLKKFIISKKLGLFK